MPCDLFPCHAMITVGEEADALSGLADMEMVTMETAVQAREQINNMMERWVL